MKIPFGTITITNKSKNLINQILESKRFSSGKYVNEFEKRFAEMVGVKEAVAVSSGTDACALALAVLYDFGAKRNDEVIVPALSFISTGSAVLQAGFIPVFVDIERETLNIDPSKIEEKITRRTRAIMPAHLMGKPADMDAIKKIARKHNLYIVEDAAEAHGAKYKGKNIGTLGDMAAFSLFIAHIISTIEGGIVATDSAEFAEILRSLRAHGRACKCKKCIINVADNACKQRFEHGTDIRFIFERVGFSCKMNEIEAAIGLGCLDSYDEILRKRRENLSYLRGKLGRFKPILTTIEAETYEETGPHAFPIVLGENSNFTRDKLAGYLEENGVDTRSLFSSIPTQCRGFEFLGHKLGDFPNAEYIGNNGIHLGVHQDLTKKDLDYIISLLERFSG